MAVIQMQEYVLIFFDSNVSCLLTIAESFDQPSSNKNTQFTVTNLDHQPTYKPETTVSHQTTSQQHLLNRYRNNTCLLDATYKTTRYSLLLLFLALKTNVDYQVAGSFAIQDETTKSIKEALHVLKKWNASWNPKMFMVDNCDEEIDAIEILFPGMLYLFFPKYRFL